MLAGIQEILSIGLIIVCIIFLPRLFRSEKPERPTQKGVNKRWRLSGKLRLAIVLSLLIPVSTALILKPWTSNTQGLFLFVGILPVIAGWAGMWVWQGFKR